MRRVLLPLAALVAGLAAGIALAPLAGSIPEQAGAARQVDAEALPVRRVVDGDTLTLSYRPPVPIDTVVRLLNVDTPERDEPGYREAREALARLVQGKKVEMRFLRPGVIEQDDYGRLLAYLFADGMNVNVEMVRQGHSVYWTRYGPGAFPEDFARAEAEARANRRGLWRR